MAYIGTILGKVLRFTDGGSMKRISILLILFFFQSVYAIPELISIPVVPIEVLTPGDLCSEDDKDFTEYRYDSNMPYCKRNVSVNFRRRIYREYKVDSQCQHRYTIDHMVPLALGGNNDSKNLWPEHVLVKATRHRLELDLYWAVIRKEISVEEAVEIVIREKTQLELDLSHVDGCG